MKAITIKASQHAIIIGIHDLLIEYPKETFSRL